MYNGSLASNSYKRPSVEQKNTVFSYVFQNHPQDNNVKSLNSSATGNYFPSRNVVNQNTGHQMQMNSSGATLNIKVKNKDMYDIKRLATDGDIHSFIAADQKNSFIIKNGNASQYASRNNSMEQRQTAPLHGF